MRPLLPILLLLAPILQAEPPSPASLARLAPSTGDVVAPLTAGLQSPDVLTRATAARVAAVRGEKAMVPALREALASETNADAAREEIRALVLAGGDDDLELAARAAAKFPPRMDGVLADAIARLGDRGVMLYPKYVKPLRRISDESNFFRLALWQRPGNDASSVAATLLADGDERGWCELIDGAGDAGLIAPAAFATALGATAPNIRLTTAHCLLRRYASDRAHFPGDLRDVVNAGLRENASPAEIFGRELLHRAAGGQTHESDVAPLLHGNCSYRALFTASELAAAQCDALTATPNDPRVSAPVRPAQLAIGGYLPPGLSSALIRDADCYEPAVGLASVTVDRAGRVRRLEASHIHTPSRCLNAIATMISLSFFDPESITSTPVDEQVVILKTPKNAPCFDATSLTSAGAARPRSAGDTVTAPTIARHTDPQVSSDMSQSLKRDDPRDYYIVVDSVITPDGCIRGVQLVKQSPIGAVNASALTALSEWRFHPATEDGVPVPAEYNLTIHFRLP
jgi:TonB family protein